jgi:hypothetical protein
MAQFSLELCKGLGIKRNISMAYHPQMDGQSERANQWLEQYLRIYGNYQQDNWARWLPLVQFVHNTWLSSTTGKTLFELIMGVTPMYLATLNTAHWLILVSDKGLAMACSPLQWQPRSDLGLIMPN